MLTRYQLRYLTLNILHRVNINLKGFQVLMTGKLENLCHIHTNCLHLSHGFTDGSVE